MTCLNLKCLRFKMLTTSKCLRTLLKIIISKGELVMTPWWLVSSVLIVVIVVSCYSYSREIY